MREDECKRDKTRWAESNESNREDKRAVKKRRN